MERARSVHSSAAGERSAAPPDLTEEPVRSNCTSGQASTLAAASSAASLDGDHLNRRIVRECTLDMSPAVEVLRDVAQRYGGIFDASVAKRYLGLLGFSQSEEISQFFGAPSRELQELVGTACSWPAAYNFSDKVVDELRCTAAIELAQWHARIEEFAIGDDPMQPVLPNARRHVEQGRARNAALAQTLEDTPC